MDAKSLGTVAVQLPTSARPLRAIRQRKQMHFNSIEGVRGGGRDNGHEGRTHRGSGDGAPTMSSDAVGQVLVRLTGSQHFINSLGKGRRRRLKTTPMSGSDSNGRPASDFGSHSACVGLLR